jgi:hypothetical protein
LTALTSPTALTAKTVAAGHEKKGVRLGPLPWRRMAWVTWRQHRFALVSMAGLLCALALWLWTAGLQLHHAYAAAASCHPASSLACGGLISRFDGMDKALGYGYALQAVPALIGAFVGAPVLARELETGTFRYAWTQGFGRWRWTVAKLVALTVVVVAAAEAFSAVTSWYYRPYLATRNQALGLSQLSPLNPGLFDLRGIGLAAWTLTAFALGVLAGMLIRRALPAVVATLATYTGLAVATGLYLRQHYLAPLVTGNPSVWVSPGPALVVSQHWATKGGMPVSQSVLAQVLQGAPPQLAGKGDGVPRALGSAQYVVQHGYVLWTSYQPASRFWSFQLMEAGWLVALSLILMATATWLVSRRPA